MKALTGSVTAALTVLVLAGCQNRPQPITGSLTDIKRHQEQQLMFNCVGQNSSIRTGGLTPELINYCRDDAEVRVW